MREDGDGRASPKQLGALSLLSSPPSPRGRFSFCSIKHQTTGWKLRVALPCVWQGALEGR